MPRGTTARTIHASTLESALFGGSDDRYTPAGYAPGEAVFAATLVGTVVHERLADIIRGRRRDLRDLWSDAVADAQAGGAVVEWGRFMRRTDDASRAAALEYADRAVRAATPHVQQWVGAGYASEASFRFTLRVPGHGEVAFAGTADLVHVAGLLPTLDYKVGYGRAELEKIALGPRPQHVVYRLALLLGEWTTGTRYAVGEHRLIWPTDPNAYWRINHWQPEFHYLWLPGLIRGRTTNMAGVTIPAVPITPDRAIDHLRAWTRDYLDGQ